MFDIGFWELVVIAVLGLLILGPERMPIAMRTLGQWIGAIKRTANQVKGELSHELRIQELHNNLKKAEELGMENLDPELARSVEQLKQAAASVQNEAYKAANPEQLGGTETTSSQATPEHHERK